VTSQTEAPPATENTTAQNNQATHPVEPPPTPAATPAPDTSANSADRSAPDQTPADNTPAPTRMPNTAANWVMMLISGGTLSGAGLWLRRKR
jgi:LPXTG-motif cell wall-anchored protein